MRKLAALLFFLAATATHAQPQPAQRWVIVGTASLTGVYFGVGGALCRVVNHYRAEHGLRCGVEPTTGSAENVGMLRARDVELAIVESSIHYHAVKGDGPYSQSGPAPELRSVMSLHAEPFTVVTRKESGIRSIADLKGKRFNVIERGTVTRGAVSEMLDAFGWSRSDFAPAPQLNADESGRALCENRIDGFFISVGHPSPPVKLATVVCGAKLVSLIGPRVADYIKAHPYVSYSTIPGDVYPANPQETRSFGVRATLMTSASVHADVIHTVTRTLFENFDMFRRLHPTLVSLRVEAMVNEGLAAPLHEGAARFYRERGWIK